MADAQKTIDLIFNGVDRTGAATLAALDNARKFSGSVKDITQPVADFTLGAAKLEAGMLAAGVAMTVFAAKTAGDFEQSFAQISTLFDASADDVARFKQDILAYAATSGKSLKDITESLQAAIGSGVEYSKSLELVSVAEKLAIATRADLKGTTEVLVSTMNAYGMKTEDSGQVADLFFQIIKDGKIEMNDLAHSFAMVSPMAAASGVSLQEVGAAIAVLTASGIAPSTAIEYLRSALTNIIKPSKQASDEAERLGIQFDAAALKSKGLGGVLADVAKATGGNTDSMAKLIGDVGGLAAAMVLTGPQAAKFAEEIKLMGASAGAVSAAYEKMANSMDVVGQRVANAFKGLLIAVGTPMLDEFGGIANAIAAMFAAVSDSAKSGGLKDLVTYVESQMAALQAAMERVAKNLPAALASADFSGFKGGIDAVIGAVQSLFGGLDLTSVDGLKNAIETLGAAFLGLSKYTAGVIESFKPLFDALVAVGQGAKDADLSFLEIAGSLGGLVTQLNFALPLFDVLIGVLAAKSGLGLVKELTNLGTLLPVLTSGLGLLAQAGGVAVAGAAGYAVGGVVNEGISALISKISGSENSLGTWIYNLTHADEAAALLGTSTTRAAGGVKTLGDAAKDVANPFEAANAAMLKNFGASEKAATSTAALGAALKNSGQYALQTVPVFDAITGKITGYEQQLVKSAKGTIDLSAASGKTADSLGKVATQTDKAKAAAEKWSEALAKMASDEKIALIGAQSKIATAQIEADAKKAAAAYDSLGVTIKSTGDVLSTLFGQVKEFDRMDWGSIRTIEKQIDKENAARDKALELQERLTTATVRQMEAQTQAMIKGDGLIKIDGAGLQPHLEAFMWEILRTIQTRVNRDGLKLLLGT